MIHSILLSLTLVLSFLVAALCQVTDEVARDQPDVVWITKSASCCEFVDSPQDLMSCVNNVDNKDVDNVAAVVTYASRSIYEYASYALGVNAMYSEHNKYAFRIQTKENGNNFEPVDQRWNKIKILSNALESKNGWAKNVEYIVWLDADLIIMDLGLRLELVGRAHPEADIIMSNDLGGSLDFANSGFVLVKNSVWAKEFLARWWDFDRPHMSDQMAFLLLMEKLSPEERNRVKLLPIDAVNTHFPPWQFQRECNQVLHLAGETDIYRRVVFQKGFRAVCGSIDKSLSTDGRVGASRLPRQLGLTKELLFGFHQEKGNMRVSVLRLLQDESVGGLAALVDNQASSTERWRHISAIKSKATNIMKDAEAEAVSSGAGVSTEFYSLTMQVLLWCFRGFREIALEAVGTLGDGESVEVGELIRMSISTAYDVMDFHSGFYRLLPEPPVEQNEVVVRLLQGVERELLPHFPRVLPASLLGKARYYDLKFYQFLSGAKEMAGLPASQYMEDRERVVAVWRELHTVYGYYGTDYISIDPLKEGSRLIAELGLKYCMDLHDPEHGVPLLREAQGLMRDTLKGKRQCSSKR
jgi:hypothetical protein